MSSTTTTTNDDGNNFDDGNDNNNNNNNNKQHFLLPQAMRNINNTNTNSSSYDLFITDGGIETTLLFHDGFELPHFAAFDLLKTETGRQGLIKYYQPYIDIAKKNFAATNNNNDCHVKIAGMILESPTWRASPDWGCDKLGYTLDELAHANRNAIQLLREIRNKEQQEDNDSTLSDSSLKFIISGCVGPRGDGYTPGDVLMTEDEAKDYHGFQIQIFAEQEIKVDMITAITMTNIPEAIGVVRAAQTVGLPCVISFTVETNGRLPTGELLKDAIQQVDRATTAANASPPAYYMINCAHTSHFVNCLVEEEEPTKKDDNNSNNNDHFHWTKRIRGIRANASRLSHAELDNAKELDSGNPIEFGQEHCNLWSKCRNHLHVFGGCCGTDHRHVEHVLQAIMEQQQEEQEQEQSNQQEQQEQSNQQEEKEQEW